MDATPTIIDRLSDDDLLRLNQLLPWKSFTLDGHQRAFGAPASAVKRNLPEPIPDPRILQLNQLFGLRDKSVLEIGCFEGSHTLGLCQYAREVHAVDARIENVVKTIVRTHLLGHQPRVSTCNVENSVEFRALPQVDVIHHVGVLYHLTDPIRHLQDCASKAKVGLLLDTHYATAEMAKHRMKSGQREWPYFHYREGGRDEIFSGMEDHAKWLLLEDLAQVLRELGFGHIVVAANEMQRNGPRVTLFAARPGLIPALKS
jgi:Methyltransferase domain